MSTRIAAAIVGCGRMGRERATHLRRLDVKVALLIDDAIERAKALADDFPEAAIGCSIDDVSSAGLDALFICTPPGARREAVLAATRAGIALFLEKPLAANLEDATWIRDRVASSGALSSVGYMNRHRSGVLRARALARTSDVLGVSCHWTGATYRVPWWRQDALSGGPVNEQATHLVDLCRYVAGEIAGVEARISAGGETAAALFTFRSGALGTLLYTCGAPEKDIGLRLFTRHGSLHLDGWDFRLSRDIGELAPAGDGENPFAAEVDAFIHALTSGDRSKIRCDVADAYETQRVMERLRASTAAGPEGMAAET